MSREPGYRPETGAEIPRGDGKPAWPERHSGYFHCFEPWHAGMRAEAMEPEMKHCLKLGLASLALINGAYADEAPTYQLNDVVVTATRTPQPLQNLLGDVTVISAEQIK